MTPIEEVYEKFKHLDKVLSDVEWCTGGEGSAIYDIAGEMYRAIKHELKERDLFWRKLEELFPDSEEDHSRCRECNEIMRKHFSDLKQGKP